MKKFNTTGLCVPDKHYMVDMSDCAEQIVGMIDDGKYFTINRARQYGKTTMLQALSCRLKSIYNIVSIDFQGIGSADFRTEESFVRALLRMIMMRREEAEIPEDICSEFRTMAEDKDAGATLSVLFAAFTKWCAAADKPVVMMIDEVDSASNNQVFLDFLAQLRFHYLEKERNPSHAAFQSVILAGVTDIKHIRSRIRDEDHHKVNSPWNIAADFRVDMSLPEDGIRQMLVEYQADHDIEMDTAWMAKEIHDYTAGYPFLVSRICQLIDEQLMPGYSAGADQAWSKKGFDEAINLLLMERNTLFESLTGKLNNYPDMKRTLHSILMEGKRVPYNPLHEMTVQMEMYGFIYNNSGAIAVSNRIFETLLYNLFITDDDFKNSVFGKEGDLGRSMFIEKD